MDAIRQERWELLMSDGFVNPGPWIFDEYAYDFERRMRVRIRVGRERVSSAFLMLTAERLTADVSSGRVGLGPESWQPVREGDADARHFHALVALRRQIDRREEAVSEDTPLNEKVDGYEGVPADVILPDGRRLFCRAWRFREAGWIDVDHIAVSDWCPLRPDQQGIVNNVTVIERPDEKAVGTSLLVCARNLLPHGWREVEFRWSASRCPRDPGDRFPAHPTLVLIVRDR